MVDPSIKCLQSPHRGSLHRVTFKDVLNSLNSDFVRRRLRFGSCLLHLTIFVSLKIFDMVSCEFYIQTAKKTDSSRPAN